jgi:hypothetical protein
MSDKRTFILVHAQARNGAMHCVAHAPDGYIAIIQPATKKRVQEEKYHAMIGDIAEQTTYAGKRWDKDDMKRILVDEFADEMRNAGTPLHHDGRLIPSENGRRVIQLGIQTADFWVKEASAFIEFLYAWGTDRDVKWSEPGLHKPAKTMPEEAFA